MPYHVFISYRRDGGAETARLLYDRLKQDGYEPFLDVEQMRSGKFNTQLYDRIAECEDFLLILSPHALDRCKNKNDWVRMEILEALKQNKNIIPFILRNFSFPKKAIFFQRSLPNEIMELRNHQGITASQEYFDATFEKLKKLLSYQPSSSPEPPSSSGIHNGTTENTSISQKECPRENNELPDRISLFELLDIHRIDEYNIGAAWQQADITQSLSVPIGIGKDGKKVYLDLHQKKDGPNVLIAGPEGSGISEFIRTLFLSIALHYSPEDVLFHFIDTSTKYDNENLKKLPHMKYHCFRLLLKEERNVIGILDEFIYKMNIIMEERSNLLIQYHADNIYQYLKQRKEDPSLPPMPHHVIAIDICDELKRDYPEQFSMLKLLGTIQTARKFGFHVIFGSHFPEGTIDDVIHSITSSKICSSSSMRWNEECPVETYHPSHPGRLFIQTPSNPYVQQLQLAYSSENAALHSKDTKEFQWFFGFSSQQESIVQAIERHMMD